MKKFLEYYAEFLQWLNRDNDCPVIETAVFSFYFLATGTTEYTKIDAPTAEDIFNKLLDENYSWINFVCERVADNILHVSFEVSRSTVPRRYGNTSVNFSGPSVDTNGITVWNPR